MYKILVINPGSTSTKIGVFDGEQKIFEVNLTHTAGELAGFARVADQFGFREEVILRALAGAGIEVGSLAAVIGRGGLLRPVESGVYAVDDAMESDLRACRYGEHASNLGALLARKIASAVGIPALVADPVVVDELDDVARVSGHPLAPRISIFHALNQKATARRYAASTGRRYEDLNLIVAHLGGGISVGVHRGGRVVDVGNALDGEGPFSPERAGSLPWGKVVELCFSGDYTRDQLQKMFCGAGGVVAHLGTNDTRVALARAEGGDAQARLVVEALAYNVAKGIGAASAVLAGQVDAVILTGGIAHSAFITDAIAARVRHIAPVEVMPGENELEALAENALRVLRGEAEAKTY